MKQGLLCSLTCLLLAACGSGPAPTTSNQPTPTSADHSSPTLTASPTSTPSPSPSADAPLSPTPHPIGNPWVQRTDVAAGPAAREDHTWTVNGDGSVAYLFGGRSTDGLSNELWAFDLVSDEWTMLRPSGAAPAPRLGHTATWVPDVGLVVWSGQGNDFFADIWAYDPLTDAWRELPSLGAVPPARYGSCASLGPDGRLWISHGFTQDDGRFADTRAYDFATGEWTDVTPQGEVPVKRCLHDCYWSSAGRLILYGGQTTGVLALGDIWAYDPATQAWSQGPQSDAPARQLYALAIAESEALVFGGGTLEGSFLSDLWYVDSASLALSADSRTEPSPAARSGATLLADAARARLLLFGGQNSEGLLRDLWEIDNPD